MVHCASLKNSVVRSSLLTVKCKLHLIESTNFSNVSLLKEFFLCVRVLAKLVNTRDRPILCNGLEIRNALPGISEYHALMRLCSNKMLNLLYKHIQTLKNQLFFILSLQS